MAGPLTGVRVIEFESLGAAPFAAMMLADMGATVLRIARPGHDWMGAGPTDVMARSRHRATLDLKCATARAAAFELTTTADILIEGFRPGVMERLGLGPDACHARNPGLVYGRLTGWGQDGPLAQTAGHDITYIALTGVLGAIGGADQPMPPLNLVGDFGGGGLLLAFGVLAALIEARASGKGQVVDAAMVDGAAVLTAMIHGLRAKGVWQDKRASNLLDGGAPFYRTYRCADGGHIAVGPLESGFWKIFIERLGLDPVLAAHRDDPGQWEALTTAIAAIVATRARDEWVEVFRDTDACVAPVLSLGEAPSDPHNTARGTFVEVEGTTQPAPAPRFSRTMPSRPSPVHRTGVDALSHWGLDSMVIERLQAEGALVTD